jgi:hypothetical protein
MWRSWPIFFVSLTCAGGFCFTLAMLAVYRLGGHFPRPA